MCEYLRVHICVYVHVCEYCVYIYIYIYVYVCECIKDMYVYIYRHIRAGSRVYVCGWVPVSVSVSVCVKLK